jgi:hypothetical protein
VKATQLREQGVDEAFRRHDTELQALRESLHAVTINSAGITGTIAALNARLDNLQTRIFALENMSGAKTVVSDVTNAISADVLTIIPEEQVLEEMVEPSEVVVMNPTTSLPAEIAETVVVPRVETNGSIMVEIPLDVPHSPKRHVENLVTHYEHLLSPRSMVMPPSSPASPH